MHMMMRSFVVATALIASATTQASGDGINGSYSTTGPVNAGTYLYADPTAVLKGIWAQDQQVQATVKVRGAYGRAEGKAGGRLHIGPVKTRRCCKEVELLI